MYRVIFVVLYIINYTVFITICNNLHITVCTLTFMSVFIVLCIHHIMLHKISCSNVLLSNKVANPQLCKNLRLLFLLNILLFLEFHSLQLYHYKQTIFFSQVITVELHNELTVVLLFQHKLLFDPQKYFQM